MPSPAATTVAVATKVTSQPFYDIPSKQQAAVFPAHNAPLETRTDWPVTQPSDLKPGEVLVRIVASGVCHTSDLHIWKGEFPSPSRLPLVGGHEGAGYIAAIGPYTKTEHKVGDAVGVRWTAKKCLSCEECRKGHESSCANSKCHGFTVDGCFTQFVVAWASHVTPIPDGMSLVDAAPILCAGVTVFKALKTSKLTAGESVVVAGAGGALGHLAVQYARVMGYDVIAIDTGADKLRLCKELGANHIVNFMKDDVVDQVMKLTAGGAHAAIVVATGATAYDQAIEYLRPNGALLVVAVPAHAVLKAPIFTTVVKSLRVLGTCVGNRQDTIEALKIASTGRVKTTIEVARLEALSEVYERIESSTLVGKVVLDMQ